MPPCHVVWFKRDLRLTDHAPLQQALTSGAPTLLLYIVEPSLLKEPHYSLRHWRFVWQSLLDMQQQLQAHQARLHIVYGEAVDVLARIHIRQPIAVLHSHEEIGLDVTFQRDRAVTGWIRQHGVVWQESPCGAVQRGLKHRRQWDDDWQTVMRAPLANPDWSSASLLHWPESEWQWQAPEDWQHTDSLMQRGGSQWAWKTWTSFLDGRGRDYARHISKPLASRRSCTRISPYLAWGNVSMREVYQAALRDKPPGWGIAFKALYSRLHWHCHFMQKFESECAMEFRATNRAIQAALPQLRSEEGLRRWRAWSAGQTGWPMVDACMRALHATGYVNFRMRAMLVSVACHHLLLDWRAVAQHLARQFLDFEPGIHYPQVQMQAGLTGVNTLRIYNPTKQALEHDPDGEFIAQWCPELAPLPSNFRAQPWLVTGLDGLLYDFQLSRDYPEPVIDLEQAAKAARERLWGQRKLAEVKAEGARILAKHVRPSPVKAQRESA